MKTRKLKRKRVYSFTAQMVKLPRVAEDASEKMTQGSDFRDLCADIIDCAQESFHVVTLSQKNEVIDRHLVSLGTLTGAPVHPREVYRHAITDCAAAVGFVHNHPSGDCAPSRDDREITARLVEAARILGFRVLDHVIVSREGYFSFVEEGLL